MALYLYAEGLFFLLCLSDSLLFLVKSFGVVM